MTRAHDATELKGGWVPESRDRSWWDRLWAPFWTLPVAIIVAAAGLGVMLPELDETGWWMPPVFHGGPAGARSVLGAIVGAMISVTGLVFSITMVVLQLASSQFTPRVLGSFLDSRVVQATLGVFTGTFVYALTVLRSVRDAHDGEAAAVPQLATTVAYVAVLASVGLFIAFIHHITASIQVVHVLRQASDDALRALDRMAPADLQGSGRGEEPIWSPAPDERAIPVRNEGGAGYLTGISYRELVDLAQRHDVVVELTRQVGEFVPPGAGLGTLWARVGADGELEVAVRSRLDIEPERTARQDVGFGLRQIVDIAERALSPGVNDPTTAVQAVNAAHTVLRSAVQRRMPNRHATGPDGEVRLVYRPQQVEEWLRLAVDEVAHWGQDSLQTPTAIIRMLDDLATVSRPEYLPTLRQLRARVLRETGSQ